MREQEAATTTAAMRQRRLDFAWVARVGCCALAVAAALGGHHAEAAAWAGLAALHWIVEKSA